MHPPYLADISTLKYPWTQSLNLFSFQSKFIFLVILCNSVALNIMCADNSQVYIYSKHYIPKCQCFTCKTYYYCYYWISKCHLNLIGIKLNSWSCFQISDLMAFLIFVNGNFSSLIAQVNPWSSYFSQTYMQFISKSYQSTLSNISRISPLLATFTPINLVQATVNSNLVCCKSLAISGHGPWDNTKCSR